MKSATTQETEAAATSGESSASAAAAAAAYMRQFENIIAPGKEASMTREFKPQVAYEFEHYSNPQKLKNDVLRSDKMRKVLEHYSRETQQPIRKLEQQARAIIDEIGLDRNMAIIRWCGIAITAIGKRICDGIYVNSESMANVRKEMGHCPVLYLPSHRSYMDFILMSYICYYYDIEIPGIAAGMGKSSCNSNCALQLNIVCFFILYRLSLDVWHGHHVAQNWRLFYATFLFQRRTLLGHLSGIYVCSGGQLSHRCGVFY